MESRLQLSIVSRKSAKILFLQCLRDSLGNHDHSVSYKVIDAPHK